MSDLECSMKKVPSSLKVSSGQRTVGHPVHALCEMEKMSPSIKLTEMLFISYARTCDFKKAKIDHFIKKILAANSAIR